mmetsp:Transcript_44477/g.107641  ORF Transcript_44477/g.107641 Transcript_44477/m.107641 type:complete len:377 (+) Transcript_44477:808-1938(+)
MILPLLARKGRVGLTLLHRHHIKTSLASKGRRRMVHHQQHNRADRRRVGHIHLRHRCPRQTHRRQLLLQQQRQSRCIGARCILLLLPRGTAGIHSRLVLVLTATAVDTVVDLHPDPEALRRHRDVVITDHHPGTVAAVAYVQPPRVTTTVTILRNTVLLTRRTMTADHHRVGVAHKVKGTDIVRAAAAPVPTRIHTGVVAVAVLRTEDLLHHTITMNTAVVRTEDLLLLLHINSPPVVLSLQPVDNRRLTPPDLEVQWARKMTVVGHRHRPNQHAVLSGRLRPFTSHELLNNTRLHPMRRSRKSQGKPIQLWHLLRQMQGEVRLHLSFGEATAVMGRRKEAAKTKTHNSRRSSWHWSPRRTHSRRRSLPSLTRVWR